MGISQETTEVRNVLYIIQHFPKIFSTINPAERCPRWQNKIITSLVCFVFFVKKKYTFHIENISFPEKRTDFYILNPNYNQLWLFWVGFLELIFSYLTVNEFPMRLKLTSEQEIGTHHMANLDKCIEYFLQYISLDVFHHLAQTPSATRSGVIFWTTVCTLDGFFSCISSDLPCARNAFSHASQVANI